jgi:hypothetical protein
MKKLIPVLMLLVLSFTALAQAEEDDEPYMRPRILALDTTLSVANKFNDEIGKIATGYTFVFTDKSLPKTVRQVYKTDNNETLRLEYKYGINEGDGEDTPAKPVVTYQKISAEAGLIVKIYNYLFGTSFEPNQISALVVLGVEIMYHNEIHQFVLESDDYSPGYWMMSFVR